jgi:hypothetical protein
MDRTRKGHGDPDHSLSKPENIYNRLEEEDDDDDSMVDAETGHEVHRAEAADETSLMTLVGDVQDKVCFIVVSLYFLCLVGNLHMDICKDMGVGYQCRAPKEEFLFGKSKFIVNVSITQRGEKSKSHQVHAGINTPPRFFSHNAHYD